MTRFLHFLTLLLFAFTLNAQTEAITTFLGIPIDGTKAEMIKTQSKRIYRLSVCKRCINGRIQWRGSHNSHSN